MHKVFDFLDDQLAELLPLLYLFGTTFGTIYFFVGRQFLDIQAVLEQDPLLIMVFIAGCTAAIGTELHAYLQQRRARQANQELLRTPKDHQNYAQIAAAARTAQHWMIALLLFQIVSSEGFWLTTINPTHATGFDWASVLARGAAIPVFLYGTGYLSRLRQDAVGILAKAAEKMLTKTMAVAGKQWGQRLESSARSGVNLAQVAVDLLEDAGETQAAKRVQLIEAALSASQNTPPNTTKGYVRSASGLYVPQRLNTSGTKALSRSSANTGQSSVAPAAAPATDEDAAQPRTRTQATPRGGLLPFGGRKRRSAVKKTPEQRVYAVLERDANASLRSIMNEAKVGRESAVKYRASWLEALEANAADALIEAAG